MTNQTQPDFAPNLRCALQASNLGCAREGHLLFQPVSFMLTEGHGLWIKGPNGIGKSSLLRMIAGMTTTHNGCLRWNNLTIDNQDYLSQLHFLGHADGLRDGLTVLENLRLTATLAQQPLQEISTALADLQLTSILHKPVYQLSAGQKRRAALARFFLIPRKLWLMDEPLTTLDIETQHVISHAIGQHLEEGGLCILTSHQPLTLSNLEALELVAC